MNKSIRVKYVDYNGSGRVRVQYDGRTRTYRYDDSLNWEENILLALRDFRDEWNAQVKYDPTFTRPKLNPSRWCYAFKNGGIRHYTAVTPL